MVNKLTLISNKLKLILKNKKGAFDRSGICFNSTSNQRFLENQFLASKSSQNSNVICFYFNKARHKAYACNLKKRNGNKVKKKRVSKGTIIAKNLKRSKKAWVSKDTTWLFCRSFIAY